MTSLETTESISLLYFSSTSSVYACMKPFLATRRSFKYEEKCFIQFRNIEEREKINNRQI